MTGMRRIGLLVFAVVALAAAGCGSSNNSSTATSSTAPASSTTSGAAAGSGGAVAIKMQNIAFDPKSVSVKVGQKVTWTNDDTVTHNVTATSGATFKSSDFNQGGTFSFTPTKAGTIKYVCTIHPGMDATLTVTK
jgi:plastocyanin